jgi:hypothetical protein
MIIIKDAMAEQAAEHDLRAAQNSGKGKQYHRANHRANHEPRHEPLANWRGRTGEPSTFFVSDSDAAVR